MSHTMLKVLITGFAAEPGGTLSVKQRKNNGGELQTHTFPAGVIKDFATLQNSAGRIVFVAVLNSYVDRHKLARVFN